MFFRGLTHALAGFCALGVAYAEPAPPQDHGRQTQAHGAALMIDACFASLPDAENVAAIARAAGGEPATEQAFSNEHAGIQNARHLGVWRGQGASWTLGFSEGELAGRPARTCYGVQNAETVPEFLEEVGARWRIFTLMAPTEGAYGRGVRETYAAELNDRDALIIVEWDGDRESAFPAITVVTFPHGPAQAQAQAQVQAEARNAY